MTSTPLPPEAALISQRRETLGLSIREAARRAGVSDGTWRRVESAQDIHRPADTIAKMAAPLRITPSELDAAGRPDAAGALRQIMDRLAAEPDIAQTAGAAEDGEDWPQLMSVILAGIADIDADPSLRPEDRSELRAVFLRGVARDAAERSRQMRAMRRIARNRK